jgi:Mor family transcriptional regulator
MQAGCLPRFFVSSHLSNCKTGTSFPCVFVVMLGMMTHVQVSGTELKVRIEKALTEKGLKKLITNLEKALNGEHSFLPHHVEAQIRSEIANAGVAVSQHGGWYRCIAAYLLLPKLDELLAVKSMSEEKNVAPIVQKLRNEALRESLGAFGLEVPARYARTSSGTGRSHVRIPREQKHQLMENFLDALPTFEALQDVLDTLPKNTNLTVKQIRTLVKRYLTIADRLQAKVTQE